MFEKIRQRNDQISSESKLKRSYTIEVKTQFEITKTGDPKLYYQRSTTRRQATHREAKRQSNDQTSHMAGDIQPEHLKISKSNNLTNIGCG